MNSTKKNNEYLNLIYILSLLKDNKILIFKSINLWLLIGLFVALFTTNQYTSKTSFFPKITGEGIGNNSSLSGLANLAGIKLNNENSYSIPPTLYPEIINSNDFKLNLLSKNVTTNTNNKISIRNYYLNKDKNIITTIKNFIYKIPSLLLNLIISREEFESDVTNIYYISEKDQILFDIISENLFLNVNEKEGIINLSYTDSNKLISAQIAKISRNYFKTK